MNHLKATFLLLFLPLTALASVEFNDFFRQPPQKFIIPSFEQGDFTYIDFGAFARALNLKTYTELVKRKMVLYFPKKQVKLSADNHFLVADHRTYRLPAPVILKGDSFFVPLQPFLAIFGNQFSGNLVYYDGELVQQRKDLNLLWMGSSYDRGKSVIILLATEKLQYNQALNASGLNLTIFGARPDSNRFLPAELPQGLDTVSLSRSANELKLTFKFSPEYKLDTVFASSHPLGIRIEISNPTALAKNINHDLVKERERWRFDTIILDPGHGGKDPGAVGPTGLKEKDIVLDIAQRLEKLFQGKTDLKVVLTRREDVFVPLYERGKIANREGGKLFVSLHCNSNRDRRVKGFQTFFLSPARNKQALEAALLENAAIQYEDDQSRYQEINDENYIILSMTQSNFIRESEQVGVYINDRVSSRTDLKDRGLDQAGFYVLYGANMPAVLFETAFISNRYEEKLLKSKKFRQTMAEALFESIMKFCREKDKEISQNEWLPINEEVNHQL